MRTQFLSSAHIREILIRMLALQFEFNLHSVHVDLVVDIL